ncbi:MAG: hypothetical protein AB1Z23_01650 [Eubacteriales bacterium]
MIIEGSFEALKQNNSIDIVDDLSKTLLHVSYNNYLPNKLNFKDPNNNKEYAGEIHHHNHTDEYTFSEGSSKIFHITQSSGLRLPKFNISSVYGDFSTKVLITKRTLVIQNGELEIAKIIANPPNYKIVVENTEDDFMMMCIAFGIIVLIPNKSLYALIS